MEKLSRVLRVKTRILRKQLPERAVRLVPLDQFRKRRVRVSWDKPLRSIFNSAPVRAIRARWWASASRSRPERPKLSAGDCAQEKPTGERASRLPKLRSGTKAATASSSPPGSIGPTLPLPAPGAASTLTADTAPPTFYLAVPYYTHA
jgi:hypothetical protein